MSSGEFPARLFDGEEILWTGRPGQGVLFTARDWFLVPFSLLWCGFMVFWEAMVLRGKAPGFFALWGVPFLLAGLYFTIGRFAVDAWVRRNTRYALTNRRVLIARSGPFPKLATVSLDRLPDMQLSEQAGGKGTIRFGQPAAYWGGRGFGAWTPALDPTPQFIAVDAAADVFDRIQRASRGAE